MPTTVLYPEFVPLELREAPDTPELAELRQLMADYDDLMEDCMRMQLSREDQKNLDDLIAHLNEREYQYWEGVPGETVEMILSHSEDDNDFPMVRQMLGAKPSVY